LPFTRDQQDLKTKIPLLVSATNESTALFDGIWLAVTTATRDARNQHRAVIIISDGGDNHSIYNLRETRQFLEEAATPVFAVMAGPSFELPEIFRGKEKKRAGGEPWPQFPDLSARGSYSDYIGPAERNGPHNLSTLAEVTGGAVFTAQKEEDLPRIVQTIGLAVRYQYLLAYSPIRSGRTESKSPNDNDVHKIHVELYPKDKFKGYGSPYYRGRYHSLQ
jgi:Ca-activated chloride channel family protein